MASDAPAPAATPLTAATTGMRSCCKRRTVGLKYWSIKGPGSARSTISGPGLKSNSDKSAPAQKPRPAPVMTKARIWASPSARSSAAHNSWCMARVKLFKAWGRFRVMQATAARCSNKTWGSDMGLSLGRNLTLPNPTVGECFPLGIVVHPSHQLPFLPETPCPTKPSKPPPTPTKSG